ncbi:helix-turn-helix domain-containing protein [Clostridium saccharoperbutylacetonicum]|uniref:helix-turn-helix domain-containing protein n=1 Tax=Clostridium saccharoperbutylacetonicum TaxID=36745 RepID=UPI0021502CFA|nr:helix-turn-helix domain-containing protein [Clostridium saccharoperbutylacetonicum]
MKELRKILNMTQVELAEGICSINNISLLENNKQKLTYKLAVRLATNFNKKSKNTLITTEELMRDEDDQANIIIENNIISTLEKIKIIKSFEEMLDEAEWLLKKYNITDKNKIKLYNTASNFYYNNYSYYKSYEMCRIGLTIAINCGNKLEEANFYISKARINVALKKYLEALHQLEHAEKINDFDNDELFRRICFNKAVLYKKMNKFAESLEYLDKIKNIVNDQKRMMDLKTMYANCLECLQEYEKSEKEYIEILDIAMKLNNQDLIALTYRNLSELHFNMKNNKNALMFINASLENNHNNSHVNDDMFFAAKIYKRLEKYSEAKKYLLRALEISEETDRENSELIENIIYELILIYIIENDEDNINLMEQKSKELNVDYRLIYLELIKYYRIKNEEKSIYFNNELIEIIKKEKNF